MTKARLTPDEAEQLLDDLCAQGGYCLGPEDRRRLVDKPPATVDLLGHRRKQPDSLGCGVACRCMKVAVIVGCALVIVGFTYYGVGAWLRDRERSRRRRG